MILLSNVKSKDGSAVSMTNTSTHGASACILPLLTAKSSSSPVSWLALIKSFAYSKALHTQTLVHWVDRWDCDFHFDLAWVHYWIVWHTLWQNLQTCWQEYWGWQPQHVPVCHNQQYLWHCDDTCCIHWWLQLCHQHNLLETWVHCHFALPSMECSASTNSCYTCQKQPQQK